jgi:hypothetical protein
MLWPKTIFIRGIAVPITSWEEFEEVAERYGTDVGAYIPPDDSGLPKPPGNVGSVRSRLNPRDRTLLRSFVDNASVSSSQIASALGKSGKAIRSGLEEWGNEIGLSENSTLAFERCFTPDGRGYRLLPHFKEVARVMLNEQG